MSDVASKLLLLPLRPMVVGDNDGLCISHGLSTFFLESLFNVVDAVDVVVVVVVGVYDVMNDVSCVHIVHAAHSSHTGTKGEGRRYTPKSHASHAGQG